MATVSAMFTITDTGDLSGRNLIQRSFFTKDPWTGPDNAIGDGFGMYHDKYCLPVTVGKLYTNTNKGVNNLFPDLVFEEGVQYTISGKWAQFRTDTKYNLFRLYIRHTDGTNVYVRQPEQQNNTWLSFKLTSTAGKTVSKITTTYGNGGITYIADFKLEVGAAATDWTPAPEDVVTAMTDAKEAKELANTKNSVYYQATAPTGNLKDGDTWFDTDNDYKISRWNAGAQEWAAAELGDAAFANIDASKIIAGSVMGNVILGGTIQAGGSDVGQDGKVLVKDANDVEVASLSKDGLVATAGSIGGWTIDETSLILSVPYTYDNSGDQVIAHGDDTDLIQVEDAQLVGGSEDDDANISLLTLGRDQSDGMPYILCDDGTLDGSQVRIKNGKISCLKNDNTLTNGISTYIQSDAVLLSESFVINDITKVNNVRLKSDKVEVLYTPDYEHRTSETIERAILTYNDLVFSGDSYQPALASGIVHWSIFSFQRTIKDTLNVTVYHCGNLFWAHFDGTIPAGWTAANTRDVFIPIYNETVLSTSVKVAPPKNLTKYIIPTDLENMRISVTVRSDGQLGISRIAEPFKGNATATIAGYMETCDIFWAHIG